MQITCVAITRCVAGTHEDGLTRCSRRRVSVLALVLAAVRAVGAVAPAFAQDVSPVGTEAVACDVGLCSAGELLELRYGKAAAPLASIVVSLRQRGPAPDVLRGQVDRQRREW